MNTFLVVYDVGPDRGRSKLSAALEGLGVRVQESVFECRLRRADVSRMIDTLRRVLGADGAGNIRIYRICRSCLRASVGIGENARPAATRGWIVV